MAEFCKDCFNRLNGTDYTDRDLILSKEDDLCEGCGLWKRIVVRLARGFWIFRW